MVGYEHRKRQNFAKRQHRHDVRADQIIPGREREGRQQVLRVIFVGQEQRIG
jgi:hypothetical protein